MNEVIKRDKKVNLMMLVAGLNIGGAEVVIQRLAEAIDIDKFNLTICCIKVRGTIGDELLESGYDVVTLTDPCSVKVDYFTFIKLMRIIRTKKIDIIHSHTVDALADAAVCKLFIPRLILIHTFHYGNYPRSEKRLMLMERVFSKLANKLVAVGEVQKKQIMSTFGLPESRISKVYNGVLPVQSKNGADFRRSVGAGERVLVGFIATLTEQKGLRDFMTVAKQFRGREREIRFVVVGEGPQRQELEELIRQYELEDIVVLTGWIQDAAAKALPAFDIFFMPSLWEAMSIAILEAMSAGKAIVATRVGENPFVLEDGVEGEIVNRGDICAMKEAIDRFVKNPKSRDRMGRAAQNKVHKIFTIEQMTKAYENIYLEMADAHKSLKNTQNAT